MAKSAWEIRMDYTQAIQHANSLEQSARELRRVAVNELQDCLFELSHNWTGQNADAYIRKGNKLKGDMLTTAKKIESCAAVIRKIAKNTYDAEMTAYRIAVARKF